MAQMMRGGIMSKISISKKEKMTKNEISTALDIVSESLDLNLYNIKSSSDQILLTIKNNVIEDNVEELQKELHDMDGFFDYFTHYLNEEEPYDLSTFSIYANIPEMINMEFYNNNYNVRVAYTVFLDTYEKCIKNFYLTAYLLTKLSRVAVKNKLNKSLIFWPC